jgi:3-dehydroquinate dehydratase-1
MQIVASIISLDDVTKVEDVANILEFRLDLFEKIPQIGEVKQIKKSKIITVRKIDDGGRFTGNEEERLSLLKKYSEFADFVDVEFNCDEIFFDMNCRIIESYHNFDATPDYEFLKELVDNKRGDFFKIATLGKSKEDVLTLVRILSEYDDVIAFLMGEKFAFTRIMSLFLGSPFIYCHAGSSVAKGQFEVHEAFEIIKRLRGER